MSERMRDQFAMAALAGLAGDSGNWPQGATGTEIARTLAQAAYEFADAMIAEQSRQPAMCPVCRGLRNDNGIIIHISGCTYGWTDG